jgi:hypothetical protein
MSGGWRGAIARWLRPDPVYFVPMARRVTLIWPLFLLLPGGIAVRAWFGVNEFVVLSAMVFALLAVTPAMRLWMRRVGEPMPRAVFLRRRDESIVAAPFWQPVAFWTAHTSVVIFYPRLLRDAWWRGEGALFDAGFVPTMLFVAVGCGVLAAAVTKHAAALRIERMKDAT